jgi:hypothetical protein
MRYWYDRNFDGRGNKTSTSQRIEWCFIPSEYESVNNYFCF